MQAMQRGAEYVVVAVILAAAMTHLIAAVQDVEIFSKWLLANILNEYLVMI